MIRGVIKRNNVGVFLQDTVPTRLWKRLVKGMRKVAIFLQRYVKQRKLSGNPLKVRTGNLRRSIKQEVIEVQNESVRAQVSTNVHYGRIHEFGYSGTVFVRHFWREGKRGKPSVMVQEHTRKVRLPKRSFLRSSLHETASHQRNLIKQSLRGKA